MIEQRALAAIVASALDRHVCFGSVPPRAVLAALTGFPHLHRRLGFIRCAETREAFRHFEAWVKEYGTDICGVCLFGSVLMGTTTHESVVVPKERNRYMPDTVWVGPSDVDCIVIGRKHLRRPSPVLARFRHVDSLGRILKKRQFDLLENVQLVALGGLESWLCQNRCRLAPMYWRLMVHSGFWLIGDDGLPSSVDRLVKNAVESPEGLSRSAARFYWRRVHALFEFYEKVMSGIIFGRMP